MSGVLVLALITIVVTLLVRAWVAIGARLDRDLPQLMDQHRGHIHDWEANGGVWDCVCGHRMPRYELQHRDEWGAP